MDIKKILLLFIFLVIICACQNEGLKTPDNMETTTPNEDALELIFYDEFNYEGLPDQTKWSYDSGTGVQGWGNWELQYYTKKDLNTAYVSNGTLKIQAVRGSVDDPHNNYDHDFTSAKLGSKCGFKYGKFEIKAKVPSGFGTWPAVWMLPFYRLNEAWPMSGEIDILEHVGRTPDEVFFSIHTGAFNYWGGVPKSKKVYSPGNWESEFHVYALNWTEDGMEWSIDGESKYRLDKKPYYGYEEWPFDKHFEIIMNLAIGGGIGFPPNTPREANMPRLNEEVFPKTFEIDYVRVYGKKVNMNCK